MTVDKAFAVTGNAGLGAVAKMGKGFRLFALPVAGETVRSVCMCARL